MRPFVWSVATVARTARPIAPPTLSDEFTSPEASPESLAVAPDMATVVRAGNARPAPSPSRAIAGITSTM
jgi:hypothetical protein